MLVQFRAVRLQGWEKEPKYKIANHGPRELPDTLLGSLPSGHSFPDNFCLCSMETELNGLQEDTLPSSTKSDFLVWSKGKGSHWTDTCICQLFQ